MNSQNNFLIEGLKHRNTNISKLKLWRKQYLLLTSWRRKYFKMEEVEKIVLTPKKQWLYFLRVEILRMKDNYSLSTDHHVCQLLMRAKTLISWTKLKILIMEILIKYLTCSHWLTLLKLTITRSLSHLWNQLF